MKSGKQNTVSWQHRWSNTLIVAILISVCLSAGVVSSPQDISPTGSSVFRTRQQVKKPEPPVTIRQILEVLEVKGGHKNEKLIAEIAKANRGVDFPMTKGCEIELMNRGATQELLSTIRIGYRTGSEKPKLTQKDMLTVQLEKVSSSYKNALLVCEVSSRGVDFDLSSQFESELRKLKASDAVVRAIRDGYIKLIGFPPEITLMVNGVPLNLEKIPADSFMMGSDNGFGDQIPVHWVTINYSFYLGEYEVTQAQWQAVMNDNPSTFKQCGPAGTAEKGADRPVPREVNCPVENVSWNDAQAFIAKLNQISKGYTYRLPSEAEWEYAARGGTKTTYIWGEDEKLACQYANVRDRTLTDKPLSGSKGVDCSDNYVETSPVGSFRPNGFHLYDMIGNVEEWCEDWYHDGYDGAPKDGSPWLTGGQQQKRVSRGGDAITARSYSLHSAYRQGEEPDHKLSTGLRLVAIPRPR
jgi:formylglycine-generating enzyme required for sulfatase activity